jgi:hypothetical protein
VTITVTVRDQTGARPMSELVLPQIAETVTLRDLIRTRVREEVAKANADPGMEFRTLVRPTEAEETLNGFRMPKRKRIDWERQAALAAHAFTERGFFVLVDGKQVEDLSEELRLTADSDIRFVKLVPLVGG